MIIFVSGLSTACFMMLVYRGLRYSILKFSTVLISTKGFNICNYLSFEFKTHITCFMSKIL